MDWTQWAANLITTLIASSVIGGIAWRYWNRVDDKVDKQDAEINRLKENNLAELSKSVESLNGKLDDHLKADVNIQTSLVKLDTVLSTLSGQNVRISDRVEALTRETAEQSQQIKKLDEYSHGVHAAVKDVRDDIKQLLQRK